jgi:hypothetical protein
VTDYDNNHKPQFQPSGLVRRAWYSRQAHVNSVFYQFCLDQQTSQQGYTRAAIAKVFPLHGKQSAKGSHLSIEFQSLA